MFGFRKLNLRGKLILILLSMALLTLLVATSLFSYNDLSIFKKNLVRHNMTIADSAGSMARAALLFEDSSKLDLDSLKENMLVKFGNKLVSLKNI